MAYLADRAIATPGQEGWLRQRKCEASEAGADGVVVGPEIS